MFLWSQKDSKSVADRSQIGGSNCQLAKRAFFRDNEEECYAYYDEIEICEKSSGAHFKAAFQVRNKNMVDRSDLVICYVETNEGGAYQTMQYAMQQGKRYLNLYSVKEEVE